MNKHFLYRVSTHGDPGKTQYYMWNYREDWEIRASYITTCYFDPDMNRIYEDSNYPTFYCWKKEISRNILIGSTEKLKEHLIINNKLLDVPVNEDRFTVLYSIQVQQRALSKEGYEYYLNVQQQNEEMGGIFTPQPSEIQGNISCISQPKRRTIGYVGVYKNISEKRIYIHPNEIKRPPLYSGCEEVSDSEMDEQGYSTYLTRYLAGYVQSVQALTLTTGPYGDVQNVKPTEEVKTSLHSGPTIINNLNKRRQL